MGSTTKDTLKSQASVHTLPLTTSPSQRPDFQAFTVAMIIVSMVLMKSRVLELLLSFRFIRSRVYHPKTLHLKQVHSQMIQMFG